MERIPGGKARGGRCPRNVDKAELAQGVKVELEHTNDRRVAREIACDHLTEDGRYYSKLATIHLDGGRRLRDADVAPHMRRRRRTAAPVAPALPTLSEAEHAEWVAMQVVTAALRSRDPAKIAQAKAALATANEATFQAWGRLPAAERLRRRTAGTAPDGM